jgi:hypothetical protein
MLAKDYISARRRATSELSELAERLSTPGASAFASPALPPLSQLPPAEVIDELPYSACDFLEHDGLVDHEQLMQAIYLSQGLDLSAVQSQANNFLREIGMRPHDLGVKNTDEKGRVMVNQCFYLSIAHAYLGNMASAEEFSALALRLKRAIEASVLAAKPSLATAKGDDVDAMAFADFLPIAMHAGASERNADDSLNQGGDAGADANIAEPHNLTAELAVCILDSIQGHVEVFLGPRYASLQDECVKERNLILLWYTPGHYQCIVRDDLLGSKVSITYENFKDLLIKHGVMYIETTEWE